MMIRHVAAGWGLVALLAGCAALTPPEPRPAFAIDCADAIDGPDAASLGGAGLVPHVGDPDSPGDQLERAAIVQSGGMLCEWARGDDEPSIQLAVLGGVDTARWGIRDQLRDAGFATRSDGARTLAARCWDSYPAEGPNRCIWVAVSGNVVMEAFFAELPGFEVVAPLLRPDPLVSVPTLEPVFDGVSAGVVREALDRFVDAFETTVTPKPVAGRDCRDVVRESEGSDKDFWVYPSVGDPRLYPLGYGLPGQTVALQVIAFERIGWTRCFIYTFDPASPTIDGFPIATIIDARGAAWLGLGRDTVPWQPGTPASCGATSCVVTLLRGEDAIRLVAIDGVDPRFASAVLGSVQW
ncbi:hypothetical protein [Schumannella luteola]